MADQLSSDLSALRIDRDAPGSPRGWTRWLLALVLLGGGGAAAWQFAVPKLGAVLFKTEIEITQIVTVSPAQADVRLTATGYVIPQRVTKVGAKVSGRLAKVYVREGDRVEAGQLLAELEAADSVAAIDGAKTRVSLARAQAAAARAQLAETRQQAERERRLVAQGVVGAATAEDLEARLEALKRQAEAADAQIRAAQSEVTALSVNLDFLKVTAPMAGTVIGKPTGEGELVGLMAASLVELADFASLMVEADVPEARLHLVKLGAPAEIQLDAFPERRFRGRVSEVSPKVDRAKATIIVKVAFVDPAEEVLPDMAARVSFLSRELEAETMKEPPKIVVPAAALAERGGAKVVFVVDEGIVRMKPVTLGPAVGEGFELLAGPPSGTKVVRAPPEALADGEKIKSKDDP